MAIQDTDHVAVAALVEVVLSAYHTMLALIAVADVDQHLEAGLDMKWTILDSTREQMQTHCLIL